MSPFSFFKKTKAAKGRETLVSLAQQMTVKAPPGLFTAYDEIFCKEMATIQGFSQSEIDTMHQIITKGEGGYLNQGRYHKALFDAFFKDREWVWPEFEKWEGARDVWEDNRNRWGGPRDARELTYWYLMRALVFRAGSLGGRREQIKLGITHAIWMHSGGGKYPRPEHVRASNERLVYEIAKGAFLEGKWTWPGVEIDCKCVDRPVLPGFQ
jgi:hypothetical protein